MNKITEEAIEALHAELATGLKEGLDAIRKDIKAGVVPKGAASFLNVTRQFLKDNGVDAIPVKGTPLGDLKEEFPFVNEEFGQIQ